MFVMGFIYVVQFHSADAGILLVTTRVGEGVREGQGHVLPPQTGRLGMTSVREKVRGGRRLGSRIGTGGMEGRAARERKRERGAEILTLQGS